MLGPFMGKGEKASAAASLLMDKSSLADAEAVNVNGFPVPLGVTKQVFLLPGHNRRFIVSYIIEADFLCVFGGKTDK